MIDFAGMVETCFDTFGETAVYTPRHGASKTVRAIPERADDVATFGETRIHAETAVFSVPVADIAEPASGDELLHGGMTYVVQGEPVRDAVRLVWRLDTRPAAVDE
ncbi:MAG: hypothetical protein AB7N54_19470 [Alphaproteobacteria bacterium]